MQTLEQFSPELEVYSIDKAFLGLSGDGAAIARQIRSTVQQWTGICVLTDPSPALAALPVGEI